MANLGDRRRPDNRIAEKFVPASDWTQDAKANYLLVDLPGFKKEELRLEIASTGHIIISGERIVDDNKCIYFHQSFPLPENSDVDNINANFDGDFLHVSVPKKSSVIEERKQQDSGNEDYGKVNNGETSSGDHENDQSKHKEGDGTDQSVDHEQHEMKETNGVASFPKEMVKKWKNGNGLLEMAMKFLKQNKEVVLSVVLAFSIGVWVCQTFESSSGGE